MGNIASGNIIATLEGLDNFLQALRHERYAG